MKLYCHFEFSTSICGIEYESHGMVQHNFVQHTELLKPKFDDEIDLGDNVVLSIEIDPLWRVDAVIDPDPDSDILQMIPIVGSFDHFVKALVSWAKRKDE